MLTTWSTLRGSAGCSKCESPLALLLALFIPKMLNAVREAGRKSRKPDTRKRRKALIDKENPEVSRTSGFLRFGAPAGIRTPDTLLKRQVLCRLSYWGIRFSSLLRPKYPTTPACAGEVLRSSPSAALRAVARCIPSAEGMPTELPGHIFFALPAGMAAGFVSGRGGRARTYECQSQSLMCYRFTTPLCGVENRGLEIIPNPLRFVGWDMGLEPTTPGTTIRCSTN